MSPTRRGPEPTFVSRSWRCTLPLEREFRKSTTAGSTDALGNCEIVIGPDVAKLLLTPSLAWTRKTTFPPPLSVDESILNWFDVRGALMGSHVAPPSLL